jgi:predicted RNase H-like HicB family nuclease
MELRVAIHEEEGRCWAEVRGCFASGADLDELKEALVEAIEIHRTDCGDDRRHARDTVDEDRATLRSPSRSSILRRPTSQSRHD